MKTTTMYEADDGNMFYTEEECVAHELRHSVANAAQRTINQVTLVGWAAGPNGGIVEERALAYFVARNWQALEHIVRSAKKAAS